MSRVSNTNMGVGCCVLILLLVVAWIFIAPLIFMLTWNAFIPVVFAGMPTLSYGVAFAGWLLVSMIGGAFRSVSTGRSEK